MTNIKPLEKLLDWKLLTGSHDWPGPHGGTCINEAAIVAAGFEYQRVSCAEDCPPCFSPVISAYLIALNDRMSSEPRQQLKRFVTRLSGSRDTPEVEQQRLEYIVTETARRIVSKAMDAAGPKINASMAYPTAGGHAAAATTATTAAAIHATPDEAGAAIHAYAAAAAAVHAATAATHYATAYATAYAMMHGAAAGVHAAAVVYNHCIEIVEGALAIGNQATDIDTALVIERMDKIRQRVTA